MGNPHVVILAYPAQGHVLPLMELAQTLAEHGVEVTFINTESTQKRMGMGSGLSDRIRIVTVPDGLEEDDNRDEHWKLYDSIDRTMPGKLDELMQEIKDDITCLVADTTLGWALEIAHKIGVHRVGFHSAAAAVVALGYSIPNLIQHGIIDQDGTPLKIQKHRLSENMPIINTTDFLWSCSGNLAMQKLIFRDMIKNNTRVELAEWFICNSNYELEPGAFNMTPQLVPIGPLLASNRHGKNSVGSFWPEDNTCLTWLDQQPDRSVIFVAFGSFTMFNKNQFEELALGLELTNRPFLWVVRPGTSNEENECYPDGFLERVSARAKMVSWAPQQKVLRHRSIACFMSHCGWNSTLEGVSSGVPFLCWPYFADQLMNESYICHVWKVGLGFKKDEKGIVRRSEISDAVEQILGNNEFSERALDLKEKIMRSVMEGGNTHKNMSKFIQWIKAGKN